MSLEDLSGEEIVEREIATGVPMVYVLDPEGRPLRRTVYETAVPEVTEMAG